ncbi:MAG TPA: right-handed parallel beta-helix repeat-containing protein [Candidatus Synoicihabitans sp.]|nr:right-handed parallel beta-helix repeat-containing protein [Candidatus Synoicihabitans sp.]
MSGDNVEIRNGVVSTTPGMAIFAQHAHYLRLIDLRVLETEGIYAVSHAPMVDRCHIAETRGYALQIGRGGVARNCTITQVEKAVGGGGGTGLQLGTGAAAIGCTIDYTDYAGIYAHSDALIQDTRVSHANREKLSYGGGILLDGTDVTIRHCVVSEANGCGILIRPLAIGTVIEETVVRRSAAAAPTIGAGIVCQNNSTTLRNNQGVFNQGGFIAGPYVDAGGNTGS